jgi:TATA-binding protein-associated factor Taf7
MTSTTSATEKTNGIVGVEAPKPIAEQEAVDVEEEVVGEEDDEPEDDEDDEYEVDDEVRWGGVQIMFTVM